MGSEQGTRTHEDCKENVRLCAGEGAERTWVGWWTGWKTEKGLPQGQRSDLEEAKVQ